MWSQQGVPRIEPRQLLFQKMDIRDRLNYGILVLVVGILNSVQAAPDSYGAFAEPVFEPLPDFKSILLAAVTVLIALYLTFWGGIEPPQGYNSRSTLYLSLWVVSGTLGGILSVFLPSVGSFIGSAFGGLLLGAWIWCLQTGGVVKTPPTRALLLLVATILPAFLSLFLRKPVLALTTSFGSPFLAFLTVDLVIRAGISKGIAVLVTFTNLPPTPRPGIDPPIQVEYKLTNLNLILLLSSLVLGMFGFLTQWCMLLRTENRKAVLKGVGGDGAGSRAGAHHRQLLEVTPTSATMNNRTKDFSKPVGYETVESEDKEKQSRRSIRIVGSPLKVGLLLISFIVLVFTFVLVITTSSTGDWEGTLAYRLANGHFASTSLKQQAKKQRLVFVDLGANRGDSFRVFMQEPNTKYNYTYAKPADREYVEFESYLFEANPFFNEPLLKTKEEFQNRPEGFGPVHIFPSTIVYTKDTVLPFFLDTVNAANDFWGSSILSTHGDSIKSGGVYKDMAAVDIGRFLLMNFLPEDFVVVKMDVEGAEYYLLPHIAEMNAHKVIDHLYVEYHPAALNATEAVTVQQKTQAALKHMEKDGVHAPFYDSAARRK
ncbi:hypothetical protein HDV05_003428 [Chytridiales sp. JEL 0842]|nr:hypothetical protein HDV05_003428 [Chytridiales sp. JEL 0842]